MVIAEEPSVERVRGARRRAAWGEREFSEESSLPASCGVPRNDVAAHAMLCNNPYRTAGFLAVAPPLVNKRGGEMEKIFRIYGLGRCPLG